MCLNTIAGKKMKNEKTSNVFLSCIRAQAQLNPAFRDALMGCKPNYCSPFKPASLWDRT